MKVPISVVIPCYNSERFIRQAIESVQAQTYPVDEIIVVDNNCVDKTVEIAEELGAIVVTEKKQNLAAARNRGIGIAKNKWIAILDSDDVWLKEKLEYQWKAIEMFPEARLIACHYLSLLSYDEEEKTADLRKRIRPVDFDQKQVIIGDTYSYASKISLNLYNWFAINASTALIHQDVFRKVGCFDESLAFREEIEFFMRALSVSPIATISKHLVYIRLHPFSMGHDLQGLMGGHNAIIKRMERFPDNYAADAAEFNRAYFKQTFLERGYGLFRQTQMSR